MDFVNLESLLLNVRELSCWGQKQNVPKCIIYIKNELEELLTAINMFDNYNIHEELGDVFMMTTFLSILLKEQKMNIKQFIEPEESKSLKLNFCWQNQDVSNCILYIKDKLERLLMSINFSEIYNFQDKFVEIFIMITFLNNLLKDKNINIEKSIINAEKKLITRYPDLLGSKYYQLHFPGYYDYNEESSYLKQKYIEKKTEFCFCNNNKCQMYRIPFSKHIRIEGKNIHCLLCDMMYPLMNSYLFYGLKKDKKIVIKVIVDYIKTGSIHKASKINNVTYITANKWIERCSKYSDFTSRLLNIRFGVDKINALEYLQKDRI